MGRFWTRLGALAWLSKHAQKPIVLAGRIGHDPGDSSEIKLQKILVILLCVGTLPLTALWSAVYAMAGAPVAAAIPAFYTFVTPISTLFFHWGRNVHIYRFVQLLMILLLPWLVMLSLGGFKESSAVIIWAALCPLASLLIEDLRQTVLWIVGFIFLLVVSAVLQPYLSPQELPEAFVTWFFVLNLGSVIAIVFALLYYFVNRRNFFQERSEILLLNVLPREIAEALKTEQRTIAGHYDAVSILFADVVEFTPMAAAMTPLSLVGLLNDVFQCFDGLVEKHGLEKIKTIGDCYMVAAGVPRERPDHAKVLVQLALEIRDAAANQLFGGRRLALRIGINSGPVVAGVIGKKKFIYDLWGDAVNIASRMESHGQSGAIQITRSTYELIKNEFECAPKGTIAVKGADRMEIWHVTAAKAAEGARAVEGVR